MSRGQRVPIQVHYTKFLIYYINLNLHVVVVFPSFYFKFFFLLFKKSYQIPFWYLRSYLSSSIYTYTQSEIYLHFDLIVCLFVYSRFVFFFFYYRKSIYFLSETVTHLFSLNLNLCTCKVWRGDGGELKAIAHWIN